MTTRTACRRRQKRHAVVRDPDACVRFAHPYPGGQEYRLTLVDVSPSGLSFQAQPEELPPIESGLSVPDTTIEIGGCEIRGEMLIMHVTEQDDGRYVSGALLYPSEDDDLVKLKAVIAGMEATQPG